MKLISLVINNNTAIVEIINKRFSRDINNNVMNNNTLLYTSYFIRKNKEVINEILEIKYIENYIYKDFESFYVLGSIVSGSSVTFDI